MAEILYGAGLRILECCRLRIKDVDFARNQIIVREGMGNKDRVVPLPDRSVICCRSPYGQGFQSVQLSRYCPRAGNSRVWPRKLSLALAMIWASRSSEISPVRTRVRRNTK